MYQIITEHKNRHKVFWVLPMYNAYPYFSLQNLGKNVHYTLQNKVVFVATVQLPLLYENSNRQHVNKRASLCPSFYLQNQVAGPWLMFSDSCTTAVSPPTKNSICKDKYVQE